jgi:FAD/FMN-containing dehydrogenase
MLNTMVKNNAGYDLKQLFIGAEGTLGVITRAVLRLHPRPACQAVALCVVDSYDAVLRVLGAARARLGPLLSAFEGMWRDYWEKVTADVPGLRAPLEIGGGSHVILIEMQGADSERDSSLFEAFLGALLEEGVVTDGAVSQSEADIADFWRLRDVAGELVRPHILGPHVAFDIGLPVREMEAFTQDAKTALRAELDAESLHYGHIGDGNMHVIAWVPGAALPYGAISRIVYDRVRALGGTVSAEHGIGLLKKPYLAHSRSEAEIALMRRIKACLDPDATLNPSKIFD